MPTSEQVRTLPARTLWLGATVEHIALALLWCALPMAPLFMAIMTGDTAPLRDWAGAMRKGSAHISELRAIGVVRRLFEQKFGGVADPDRRIEGSCSHCGRCCINGKCVFVSFATDGHSHCAIHGRWFFRLLACGAYPISARDIATYHCPSFVAVAPARSGQRVIPIVARDGR